MNGSELRQWVFTTTQASSPLNFSGTDTGLRFFSVYARNGSGQQLGNVFVGRVPVLYYPRYFGGASEATSDGKIMPFVMSLYMIDVVFGGGILLPAASTPYNIQLTFDKIPGAAGYDIFCVSNGKDWSSEENIPQPAGDKISLQTDYIIEEGETIFYVLPYMYDINGTTKLYGEMRTVVFRLRSVPLEGLTYWETSIDVLNPTLIVN